MNRVDHQRSFEKASDHDAKDGSGVQFELYEASVLDRAIEQNIDQSDLDQFGRGFGEQGLENDLRKPNLFRRLTKDGRINEKIQTYQRNQLILMSVDKPDQVEFPQHLTICRTLLASASNLVKLYEFGDQLHEDINGLVLPAINAYMTWIDQQQPLQSHKGLDTCRELLELKQQLFQLLCSIAEDKHMPSPSDVTKVNAAIQARYQLLSIPTLVLMYDGTGSKTTFKNDDFQSVVRAKIWLQSNKHLLVGENAYTQSKLTLHSWAEQARGEDYLTLSATISSRKGSELSLLRNDDVVHAAVIGEKGLKSVADAYPTRSVASRYVDYLVERTTDSDIVTLLTAIAVRQKNYLSAYALAQVFEQLDDDEMYNMIRESNIQSLLTHSEINNKPNPVWEHLDVRATFWDQHAAALIDHPTVKVHNRATQVYARQVKYEKETQETLAKIEHGLKELSDPSKAKARGEFSTEVFVKKAVLDNRSVLHRLEWHSLSTLYELARTLGYGKLKKDLQLNVTKNWIEKLNQQRDSGEINPDEALSRAIELATTVSWHTARNFDGYVSRTLNRCVDHCSLPALRTTVIEFSSKMGVDVAKKCDIDAKIVDRLQATCNDVQMEIETLRAFIEQGAHAFPGDHLSPPPRGSDSASISNNLRCTAIKRFVDLTLKTGKTEQLMSALDSSQYGYSGRFDQYQDVLVKPRIARKLDRWLSRESDSTLAEFRKKYRDDYIIGKHAGNEIAKRERHKERIAHIKALPGNTANGMAGLARSTASGFSRGAEAFSSALAKPWNSNRSELSRSQPREVSVERSLDNRRGHSRQFKVGKGLRRIPKRVGKALFKTGKGLLGIGVGVGSAAWGVTKYSVVGTTTFVIDQGMRASNGIANMIDHKKDMDDLKRAFGKLNAEDLAGVVLGYYEPLESKLTREIELDTHDIRLKAKSILVGLVENNYDREAIEALKRIAQANPSVFDAQGAGLCLVGAFYEQWKRDGFSTSSEGFEALLEVCDPIANGFKNSVKSSAITSIFADGGKHTQAILRLLQSVGYSSLSTYIRDMDAKNIHKLYQETTLNNSFDAAIAQALEPSLIQALGRGKEDTISKSSKSNGGAGLPNIEIILGLMHSKVGSASLQEGLWKLWIKHCASNSVGPEILLASLDPESNHYLPSFASEVSHEKATKISDYLSSHKLDSKKSRYKERELSHTFSMCSRIIDENPGNNGQSERLRYSVLASALEWFGKIQSKSDEGLVESIVVQLVDRVHAECEQLEGDPLRINDDFDRLKNTYETALKTYIKAASPERLLGALSDDNSLLLRKHFDKRRGFRNSAQYVFDNMKLTAGNRINGYIDQGYWHGDRLIEIALGTHLDRKTRLMAGLKLLAEYKSTAESTKSGDELYLVQLMQIFSSSFDYVDIVKSRALLAFAEKSSIYTLLSLLKDTPAKEVGRRGVDALVNIRLLQTETGENIDVSGALLRTEGTAIREILLQKICSSLSLPELDGVYKFAMEDRASSIQIKLKEAVTNAVKNKYANSRDIREYADDAKSVHKDLQVLIAEAMVVPVKQT